MKKEKKKEEPFPGRDAVPQRERAWSNSLHFGYGNFLDLKGFARFKQKENKKVII